MLLANHLRQVCLIFQQVTIREHAALTGYSASKLLLESYLSITKAQRIADCCFLSISNKQYT